MGITLSVFIGHQGRVALPYESAKFVGDSLDLCPFERRSLGLLHRHILGHVIGVRRYHRDGFLRPSHTRHETA